jgi:hypothetical membrane protein
MAKKAPNARSRLDTYRKLAGLLLFLGAGQFIIAMFIGEAICSNAVCSSSYKYGYNIADDAISNLGVGAAAGIFNTSIIILGVAAVLGAYLLFKVYNGKVITLGLVLTGIGATGVGIFPETFFVHGIFAFTAFIFSAISAVAAYRITDNPFRYVSLALGALVLVSLTLIPFLTYPWDLGIGPGGIERLQVYPALLWAIAFGGYLMSHGVKRLNSA